MFGGDSKFVLTCTHTRVPAHTYTSPNKRLAKWGSGSRKKISNDLLLMLTACAQLTIKRKVYLLSLAGYQSHPIGPFINKSSPHRILSHLHQNTIPQWKQETQSFKEKAVIIKRVRGQVSTEKRRYVFLTTYALSKTKQKKNIFSNLPQHSHNETHDTQGLMTNQTQPSRHPKHTEPTFAS